MIKVLSTSQIREADQYTIQNEPISSYDLMERAARACYQWIQYEYFDEDTLFHVFAGIGNNGGDGLAIARMIAESGYHVKIYVVKYSQQTSPDFNLNLEKLYYLSEDNPIVEIQFLEKSADIQQLMGRILPEDVVIDAIFGSGLNRQPEGIAAETIEFINMLDADKIAIDIPSGLFGDGYTPYSSPIVKATYTLTLGAPKLALFLPENEPYVGEWEFLDIQLHPGYLSQAQTRYFLIDFQDIQQIFPPRPIHSHKGCYGHVLICSGSKQMPGAAALSVMAATRSGVGLVTAHVPQSCVLPIQIHVPDALLSLDDHSSFISSIQIPSKATAVAFGPGVGNNEITANALYDLLTKTKLPLVIDADGLNILANHKEWLDLLPENSILTPHIGEFERLFGHFLNHLERIEAARQIAQERKILIVLKGAYTSIHTPEGETYFNPTGNPGMAKGGSGDVLTGLMAGLLARLKNSKDASMAAAFLHGLAGDLASKQKTVEAMTATDLIYHLADAWKEMLEE
ncbi:MAG: NAD(P)H-hydrate dehydratase [Bacteroidales bacterium]|nr:NAD(P)H-hydrate dehydratase [Bacteroidales bacterium]